MKIITFWGGLGNQIFEYAYYRWLRDRYPKEKIYGFYPRKGLCFHNGLEIFKRFDLEEPRCCLLTNTIATLLFYFIKIQNRLNLPLFFTCNMHNKNYNAIFHCDWWQNLMYFSDDYRLKFKKIDLSFQNKSLIEKINSTNSISVHIRRGDYLDSNMNSIYAGICTNNYYEKAIAEIDKRVDQNKLFIFFSDDPDYVCKHYQLPNMIVVDWNKGEDSFIDMYLMSKCKYMILANSTFSYWAAMFNKTKKLVVCPIRWNNLNNPDITQNSWIPIAP